MIDRAITIHANPPTPQKTCCSYSDICIFEGPNVHAQRAIVLFCSNRRHYPNTGEEDRTLLQNNRFEWNHALSLGCRGIVLVSDIYKTWYLRWICTGVPNPMALAALLRRELSGWDMQMAGVSSGGYAAVLFGCLLGARRVFSLAGQFSLWPMLEDAQGRDLNPFLATASTDPALARFLDLGHHFSKAMPEIFYVAPIHSSVDQHHLECARAEPRIRLLAVDSDQHDANLLRPALRRLFSRSSSYLDALVKRTPPGGWDRLELSRRIAGNRRHFAYLLRRRRDLLPRRYPWPRAWMRTNG